MAIYVTKKTATVKSSKIQIRIHDSLFRSKDRDLYNKQVQDLDSKRKYTSCRGVSGEASREGIQFIRPLADFQTSSTSDSLLH